MGGSDKTNFDKLKFTFGCEAWGKKQEKSSWGSAMNDYFCFIPQSLGAKYEF